MSSLKKYNNSKTFIMHKITLDMYHCYTYYNE